MQKVMCVLNVLYIVNQKHFESKAFQNVAGHSAETNGPNLITRLHMTLLNIAFAGY